MISLKNLSLDNWFNNHKEVYIQPRTVENIGFIVLAVGQYNDTQHAIK